MIAPALRSVPELLDTLAHAPAIVVPLAREVPESLRKRRPRPGKWSAHEHACHLAVVHDLFFERLERFENEEHPVFRAYDPGRETPDDALLRLDFDEQMARFEADRARLVERLRAVRPELWQRRATHSQYSHYSLFILFRHVALHDFLHAYRIEELLLEREWAAEWRAAQANG